MGLDKSKIVCEECGHEQGYSPITCSMAAGVERTYLRCEKCGAEYTAFYTNPDIRELQKRQQKISRTIGKRLGSSRLETHEEFRNNKAKIKAMMDVLKEIMEG